MTVGAVIVPDGVSEALADATGRSAVRRIVDAAWAGGAIPIIVVAADPDDRIAGALEGSPAVVMEPGRASEVQTYRLGAEAAGTAVQETSAVLLWPGRMTWADPETVTSLIEAHGRRPDVGTRPRRAGESGWPVLLPLEHVATVLAGPGGTVADALADSEMASVELGDPGSVLGHEVALDDLPDYAGPPEPVGGPPPEWGAAAAETPEPELNEGGV
ncbi:MAG: NTP transferase domain-containing protein [Chloroflexota bacterium]|nr:NTP transferase domain-containing protein [Chloroflexota bacterium]